MVGKVPQQEKMSSHPVITEKIATFALTVGHVLDLLHGGTFLHDDVVVWAADLQYILDDLQENGDKDIDEHRDTLKSIMDETLLELDLEPQEEDPVNCTD